MLVSIPLPCAQSITVAVVGAAPAPEPEGPSSAVMPPFSISKSMPSAAMKRPPLRVLYSFRRPSTCAPRQHFNTLLLMGLRL